MDPSETSTPATPSRLFALLARGGPILADGAFGTMAMAAGLEPGEPPEPWNDRADARDRVRAIHAAYIAAGAQVVLTNTFGANPVRLRIHDLADRSYALCRAGAEVAREAAGDDVAVAGSLGPLGEFLAPLGLLDPAEARDAFATAARGLADGGADVLWVETMASLDEATAAIAGARDAAPGLPIVATMTFDSHGRTMMGTWPADAATALRALDLTAMGANCGTGPAEIETAIASMHATAPDAILVAKGNAGVPRFVGTSSVYDMTPEAAALHAVRARDLGARLIGGCCGTTPAHIAAMATALRDG